jgi:hypothetical protein
MSTPAPASASASKPAEAAPKPSEAKEEEEAKPHLGVLEEDDEFEEFPIAGAFSPSLNRDPMLTLR